MKKRMIVTIVIVLFFVAIKSSADMRITPDGVTSSDDSASLRLSGDFNSACLSPCDNPNAAVISGTNSSGLYSCGVYGSANSYNASGVHGTAAGLNGSGVYGKASNSGDAYNKGGNFEAAGIRGVGVYGYASKEGDATNYGGKFVASGDSGFAVYGSAAGIAGRGVFGIASGTNGRGVDGNASGAHGRGVMGYGEEWDFYARGPGGNYGPFTGAHEVIFPKDMQEQIVPGLIVSATGKTQTRKDKNGEISLSSTLPTVTISAKARDKAVFGVIVSKGPLSEDHWYKGEEGDHFGVVNALGEGRVWVTNRKGDIRAGDYITTSEIPGYGQMQDDDLLHSYTLGKAIETIDWDQVTETAQHDGKTYKRYLIAVVYTSG
jgi:hypothetical protein